MFRRLLLVDGLPEGELTTGEERRKAEGDTSLVSRLGNSGVMGILCSTVVLTGRGGFSRVTGGGDLGMSKLTAVDLRGRCGLPDLGCMERRGLAEGEEAEELESNKFSALELAPRVTDASRPTPCAPFSVCLGLAGAAPREVAEVAFLSCLGVVGFFLRDGDADFVLEPLPPPIITDRCPPRSRPRAFFNNAGLSLLILSPLLSPTSLLVAETAGMTTQLLTRAGEEGFCTLGGGSGFGFFWTPAGKLG